ncbi:MAG: cytochrome P450 [Pseudonocardiaceae bacterium]
MLFDFTDADFRRDPWPAYQELRRAGGVTFSPETGCYLITSHAGVKTGLSHPDLVADYPLRSSRTLFGPSMLDTDGSLHRALKRLVNPFFGSTSVNSFTTTLIEPVIAQTITGLTASLDEPFDFIDLVARRVPYLIMTSVMGIPTDDARWLYHTIRPVVEALDYPPPQDREPAERARDELNKYFMEQLENPGRTDAARTIISQLAGMVKDDTLTRAHALSSILLMLVAGTETSISAISNIMHCMLRWPATTNFPVQSIVRESLRWEPPLHSVIRFAAKELTIEGVRIQRKRPVLLVIASANRDESAFPEPDRFDPGQSSRKAMSFGAGSHGCPGSFLAEREFNTLFSALRRAFLIEATSDRFPDIVGHVFRRPPTLPIRVKKATQLNPRELAKS